MYAVMSCVVLPSTSSSEVASHEHFLFSSIFLRYRVSKAVGCMTLLSSVSEHGWLARGHERVQSNARC